MTQVPATADREALLARIAEYTQALRQESGPAASGPRRDVERQLLDDLRQVAAALRADVTALGESLAAVFDLPPPRVHEANEQAKRPAAPPPNLLP